MLNYIPFYTHIWNDKKFKSLPDNDNRILFIYLFANSQVTLTGIYELDLETCMLKAKTKRPFKDVLNEIVDSKMIMWDDKNDVVFIVNRFKLIPNKSPKIIQGVINELNLLKHPFKDEFINTYNTYFGNYKPLLNEYSNQEVNILTPEQIMSFSKLGWQKQRIKTFYMNEGYPEQKIDELLLRYFPNLK